MHIKYILVSPIKIMHTSTNDELQVEGIIKTNKIKCSFKHNCNDLGNRNCTHGTHTNGKWIASYYYDLNLKLVSFERKIFVSHAKSEELALNKYLTKSIYKFSFNMY